MPMINDQSVPPPEQTNRMQRNARLVLILALVALGAWTLHGFIAALVWAAIIAIAIGPLYAKATLRWPPGKHNIALPLLFTTLVAVIFLLPFIVLGIQAAREAQALMHFGTEAMRSGIPEPAWVGSLPFGAAEVSDWWKTNLANPSDVSGLVHHATHSAGMLNNRELWTAFTHRIVTFFFTIVTLFFLLRDGKSLSNDMLLASHKLFGPHGERIARQMVSSVHGTVDGLVLVGLGEGVLLGIAYALAGVPHPTLLGAFSAVAAMIPFVVVVLLLVLGAVLVAQGALWTAIALVAFGLVMNSIADHFVRPGLIGGATKLPFLWVLLGILGGVETWGLIGLFVGPAVMSALILLWREFVRPAPLLDEKPARKTLSPVPIAGE
ncbi:AI-2E family transporter [Lichenihabitans psoromatis]|uniref:AI-2E family transporter n=1 Tax=Lichenihabitans psoromatis TaxID=2528642 RepID=UPI003CCA8825